MAEMGFTPNLVASASILPFRFCNLSGAFQGAPAAAGTEIPVGVTDGSVYQYDKTEHAIAGRMITLQPSNTVQIEVGTGGVSAGDFLMPETGGKAVVLATAGNYGTYIALEAGTAGDIIRAFRTGTKKV